MNILHAPSLGWCPFINNYRIFFVRFDVNHLFLRYYFFNLFICASDRFTRSTVWCIRLLWRHRKWLTSENWKKNISKKNNNNKHTYCQ
jgi:hypothetical protein